MHQQRSFGGPTKLFVEARGSSERLDACYQKPATRDGNGGHAIAPTVHPDYYHAV